MGLASSGSVGGGTIDHGGGGSVGRAPSATQRDPRDCMEVRERERLTNISVNRET